MSFNIKKAKLVATDLDGTFLRNDHSISPKNLEAMHRLGKKNIVMVAATGRNLTKVKEVISPAVPFDFVVYSSGAGIYDWKNRQHVYSRNVEAGSAQKLISHLVKSRINFNVYFPTPENHRFWYFRGDNYCDEFERYLKHNHQNAVELKPGNGSLSEVCQFLVIIPEDELQYSKLKTEIEAICGSIRVIRASSPVTKGFIWAEVFHHSVSKGNGISHICDILQIDSALTVGIGNDYNDFDLLAFTQYSFLTDNAPENIKHLFPVVPSNEEDAFAKVVQPILS